MTSNSTKSSSLQSEAEAAVPLLDDWFDPIEAGLRDRVREFIQAMIESELETALARPRYGRRPKTDPRECRWRERDLRRPARSPMAVAAGSRSRCRAPGSTARQARQPS